MAKKAVCVGINDYPIDGADLKGCVNDASAWAELVIDHFGFRSEDVVLLLDKAATKSAILAALAALLKGATDGDVLVFTNSSHGSQIPDADGDEAYDEVLCPYDIRDASVTDDELRSLFTDLPEGVHLTVISDSCHSGTVTRALLSDNIPGIGSADDRRVRFLNPGLFSKTRLLADPMRTEPRVRLAFPQSTMSHLLLSGCQDNEYSYDANIDGDYHGAMSYHAIRTIAEADYHITYADLRDRLVSRLENAGFQQHPQLEGKSSSKRRLMFS